MRFHNIDFEEAVGPSCTSNCDPFMRPDYRGKKRTRPVGRVVHKCKPRRARVVWETVV